MRRSSDEWVESPRLQMPYSGSPIRRQSNYRRGSWWVSEDSKKGLTTLLVLKFHSRIISCFKVVIRRSSQRRHKRLSRRLIGKLSSISLGTSRFWILLLRPSPTRPASTLMARRHSTCRSAASPLSSEPLCSWSFSLCFSVPLWWATLCSLNCVRKPLVLQLTCPWTRPFHLASLNFSDAKCLAKGLCSTLMTSLTSSGRSRYLEPSTATTAVVLHRSSSATPPTAPMMEWWSTPCAKSKKYKRVSRRSLDSSRRLYCH